MDNNGLTTGDLALLKNDDNSMGGLNGLIYLAIIAMMFGGWGGFGARGPVAPNNYVTSDQLQEGLNNSQTQNMLTQILQSSQNNNYETAQLINGQTQTALELHNADQTNFLQTVNSMQMQSANQNSQLLAAIADVGNTVRSCCCEVKTQMLKDRLEDQQAQNVALQNALNNAQQTQNILGSLGRFVAWAGSGSQAAGASS